MLTIRDMMATLLTFAAALVYGLWLTDTALGEVSPRAVGAVVLVLGFLGCTTTQQDMTTIYGPRSTARRPPKAYIVTTSALGAVSLLAGIWTLVTGDERALAVTVLAIVGLWVLATMRHLLRRRTVAVHDDAVRDPDRLTKAA